MTPLFDFQKEEYGMKIEFFNLESASIIYYMSTFFFPNIRKAPLFERRAYENWITVQCTPTLDRISSGQASEVVSTILDSIEKRGMHKNFMIIHVLNHTGIPVYNAICEAVRNERELGSSYYPLIVHATLKLKCGYEERKVIGCILDSCPKRPDGLLEQLHEKFPNIYDFLMLIMYVMRGLFPELFGECQKINAYDEFCYDSNPWPQLFLYSTTDHVVSYTDVENAARIRDSASVHVEMKCWGDTENACHLFSHEQEYTHLCQTFVESCLEFT